jgi:hypothetical protein
MNVEDVPGPGLAFEVDEVNDAFGIDGGLWLDAVIGCAERGDLCAPGSGQKQKEQQSEDLFHIHNLQEETERKEEFHISNLRFENAKARIV